MRTHRSIGIAGYFFAWSFGEFQATAGGLFRALRYRDAARAAWLGRVWEIRSLGASLELHPKSLRKTPRPLGFKKSPSPEK